VLNRGSEDSRPERILDVLMRGLQQWVARPSGGMRVSIENRAHLAGRSRKETHLEGSGWGGAKEDPDKKPGKRKKWFAKLGPGGCKNRRLNSPEELGGRSIPKHQKAPRENDLVAGSGAAY